MAKDKVYKVMHKEDLENLSKDELIRYAISLQIDLNLYIQSNKDLEHMLKTDELKKYIDKLECKLVLAKEYQNDVERILRRKNKIIDLYRNRTHTYKIEMGRCSRKLSRIHRLFKITYYEACKAYYKGEIPFEMVEAVREVRKELKNV